MKKIKLTQGKFAIVDDEDFTKLNKFKWYFSCGYARRNLNGEKQYLHIIVNNTPKGLITDHINRDKLDNRRSNLRAVEKRHNVRNHKLLVNNSFGFNGVSWSKIMKKWEAYIWKNSKKICLGYFDDISLALSNRKQAEIIYWND